MKTGRQPDLDTFSLLLESVYESTTDPAQWSVFLQGLARALDAKSGMFRVIDERGPAIRANVHYNLDPELQEAHRDYFVHRDAFLEALRDQPAGFIMPGEAILDYRELKKTEFFADYMAPQDSHHVCGGLAMRNAEFTIKFGLQRDRRAGPFSSADADFIRRFVPHIQRAARLGHMLDLADQQQASAEQALESLGVGAILLDECRQIIHANGKALSVLEQGCGVKRRGDHLVATHEADARRLGDLLATVHARARLAGPAVPEAMLLTPGAAEPQLLLVAWPEPSNNTGFRGPWPRTSVTVFLSNLADAGLLHHEVLVTLYGLTASEAHLACALSHGRDLAGLAEDWGVTRETLRTHLKRALQKTGTRRQAELVRLLAGAPWDLFVNAE